MLSSGVIIAKQEAIAVREQFQGTEHWLRAPNGAYSNLSPEQWVQVRTDSFKAWFGDWEHDLEKASKIVDENGEPLNVYHGTSDHFDAFDARYGGKRTSLNGQLGFYFTNDYDLAKMFTKNVWHSPRSKPRQNAHVLICFLNIRNPCVIGANKLSLIIDPRAHKKQIIIDGYDGMVINPLNTEDQEEFCSIFGKRIVKEYQHHQYVAYQPNQVKSACFNNGAYSLENDAMTA